METLKEKAKGIWEGNKVPIVIAGLLWKVLVTAIMVEQCNGPKELPDTIKQKVDFTSDQCDE